MNIYDIAKLFQFNEKSEAQAIIDYTELLKQVSASSLSDNDKQTINDIIEEIISDESNHQQKLHSLYSDLTGIQPAED